MKKIIIPSGAESRMTLSMYRDMLRSGDLEYPFAIVDEFLGEEVVFNVQAEFQEYVNGWAIGCDLPLDSPEQKPN